MFLFPLKGFRLRSIYIFNNNQYIYLNVNKYIIIWEFDSCRTIFNSETFNMIFTNTY